MSSQSSSLIITSNNSTRNGSSFTIRFPRAISFQNKEIGLISSQFFYSNPNITQAFNNNRVTIRYIQGGVNKTLDIVFPDGYYSYSDIQGFLETKMTSANIFWTGADGERIYPFSIVENPVYYSATISFVVFGASLPAGVTNTHDIDFSASVVLEFNDSFGDLLGFSNGVLPRTLITSSQSFNSERTPNIAPINSYCIACSLVNDITFNADFADVVHIINPDTVKYGGLISTYPTHIQFFQIADGTYSQATITVRDQDNRNQVNFLDYSAHLFKFVVRDRKN